MSPDDKESSLQSDSEELIPAVYLKLPVTILIYLTDQTALVDAVEARLWREISKPIFFLSTFTTIIYLVELLADPRHRNSSSNVHWFMVLYFLFLIIPFVLVFHLRMISLIGDHRTLKDIMNERGLRTSLFLWCYVIGVAELFLTVILILDWLGRQINGTWMGWLIWIGIPVEVFVGSLLLATITVVPARMFKYYYSSDKSDSRIEIPMGNAVGMSLIIAIIIFFSAVALLVKTGIAPKLGLT